jgi:pimeloyl-ACP methyl ester carboxylesterase
MECETRFLHTPRLKIAYEESGDREDGPVILLHGFPDDTRTWDRVAPDLAAHGHRVLVPYLRGYGPTRFLDPGTPRSGEQAALGDDLLAFMDALGLGQAILVGYDWGGRAACVVSALWPERVRGLVSVGGYNIQDIAKSGRPTSALQEFRYWYQWYFQTERGRAGLASNRRDICRLLWELWSPNWKFTDEEFARTAASFDNPDFVDVAIHSYRHRYAAVAGDPALQEIERRLAQSPMIPVPTVVLHGACDGVAGPETSERHARYFSGRYRREVVPIAGHFLPREAPEPIIAAIAEVSAG